MSIFELMHANFFRSAKQIFGHSLKHFYNRIHSVNFTHHALRGKKNITERNRMVPDKRTDEMWLRERKRERETEKVQKRENKPKREGGREREIKHTHEWTSTQNKNQMTKCISRFKVTVAKKNPYIDVHLICLFSSWNAPINLHITLQTIVHFVI